MNVQPTSHRRYRPLRRAGLLLATLFTLGTLTAHADDYTWTYGSGSSFWFNTDNWTGGSEYPGFNPGDNVVGNTVTNTGSVVNMDATFNNFTPTTTNWTVTVASGYELNLNGALNVTGLNFIIRGDGELNTNALNVSSTSGVNGYFSTSSGGTLGVRVNVGAGGTNLVSAFGGRTATLALGPLDGALYAGGGSDLGVVNFSGASGNRALTLMFNPSGTTDYTQTVTARGLNDAPIIGGTTSIYGAQGHPTGTNVLTSTLNLDVAGSYATAAVLADGFNRGTLALVKNGAGTQTLLGASTFSRGTTVNAGTLVAGNASALGIGAVNVTGGRLETSVANLTVGENLEMTGGFIDIRGTDIGTITLANNMDLLLTGGILEMDIASLLAYDAILGGGTGTFLADSLTLDLTGSALEEGTYDIFSGFASGSVSNISFLGIDGYSAVLGTDGGLTLTAVPEPGALSLLAVAGLAVHALRRRRNA